MRRTAALIVAIAFAAAGCTGADDSVPSTETSTAASEPAPAVTTPDPVDPTKGVPPSGAQEVVEPSGSDSSIDETEGCVDELTYADEMDWSLPQPDPDEFVSYDFAGQIQEHGGAGLQLTGLRAATHDGFDRVVAEYTSDGPTTPPGLYASYVNCAYRDGSGFQFEVTGADILKVSIQGPSIYWLEDGTTFPDPEVDPPGTAITDVDYQQGMGGGSGLYLGVGYERADFRVFSLTDPYRVVIDVAHPD
ncbi:AMIN-like domain-containing (lipo)protein [Ruania alba]|uniref:AMIN-like domain-containing protein n=1 Tax=Ruania alba TaxID=648782 RepID=A0A1H5M1S7_9MICO|nr:hypothetical protein [Ruania alba]SEE83204.1 hypothetical protein SAMN04488554_3100 [Ruania alba]